jgi:HEAT repeat protein
MRPKFVFALILLVALVLGAALYLKQHLGNAARPSASPEIATPAPAVSNAVMNVASQSTATPTVTNTMTPEQRQAAIDAETDRLQQLSMKDDPASLSAILADLTNPEKEVREAAIEAAKQFGSSNAIPTLKAVAADTTDTGEQIALIEAADFLSLPSIDFSKPGTPKTPEQIQADEQRRAQAEARRQARLQKHAGNPDSQSTSDQNSHVTPNN